MQMPVNLSTINEFYGKTMTPCEVADFMALEIAKAGCVDPANLEEKAVSLIGFPLYDAFIRGYTKKQWGIDPKELPADIITRLPVRFNYKSDYFNDPWQGIPLDGYQKLFARILDHPRIEVALGVDYFHIRDKIPNSCTIIYTGPIDRFFDYRFGRLGWRTLTFEKDVLSVNDFQGTSVMNFPDEHVPFTRIHEFRHYHEERPYPLDRTVIYREFSRSCREMDNPYYPINTDRNRSILSMYQTASESESRVIFGGRLGMYRYFDMDKTIAAALEIFDERIMNGKGGR